MAFGLTGADGRNATRRGRSRAHAYARVRDHALACYLCECGRPSRLARHPRAGPILILAAYAARPAAIFGAAAAAAPWSPVALAGALNPDTRNGPRDSSAPI